MKLKYEAPKGMRTNRGFRWVDIGKPVYWWSYEDKRWMLYDDIKGRCSTCAPCRTVKAFKRMLRKNPILLQGNPVLAHSHYIERDDGSLISLDVRLND